MATSIKNESPSGGSIMNNTPNETKSEAGSKLAEMRNAYFKSLREAAEAGSLSEEELMLELYQTTEQTTGAFTAAFGTVLTPEERKRLSSAGVSKHGFIDVCLEKAREMPSLLPSWLTLEQFEYDRMSFEAHQEMLDTAQRYDRIVGDALLTATDKAYHDALAFYKSVKDAVAAKVPGAAVIFEKLSAYFKANGQRKKDAPTEAEVERDVRSLLHGTKEGRVVIENTKPHTVAGTHKVIDETN